MNDVSVTDTRWDGDFNTRPLPHRPAVHRTYDPLVPPCPHPRLYLAGPMGGIKQYNFPEFFRVEGLLDVAGFDIFNPARNDTTYPVHVKGCIAGSTYASCTCPIPDTPEKLVELVGEHDGTEVDVDRHQKLRDDLNFICMRADGMALLDGWWKSSGAQAEIVTAWALGKPVAMWDSWLDWGRGGTLHVLIPNEPSRLRYAFNWRG